MYEPSQQAYPPKPVLPPAESQSLGKTLYSLLLFVAAFYFVFDSDLIYIGLIVLILLIHELGHFLAMRFYGYKDVKMFFVPLLGALVVGEKDKISQRQRSIILLAGPVPGIIIGVLLYFWLDGNREILSGYPFMAANIFVLLNVFNLLPVTPLDGGHLLETLFFSRRSSLKSIFMILSIIIMAGFAIISQSWFLLIIPIFLMLRLKHVKDNKELQGKLLDKGLNINQSFDELSDEDYWTLRAEVLSKGIIADTDPNLYELSPKEGRIQDEIKNILINPPIGDLSAIGTLLLLLVWLGSFFLPIAYLYWQRMMG